MSANNKPETDSTRIEPPVTPNTIESIPSNTIAEATVTTPNDISITTHSGKSLTEHVTDRSNNHVSNTETTPETTRYVVNSFPTRLAFSAVELIKHDGIQQITVTIEKQDAAQTLIDIQQRLRRITVDRLLAENEEFKLQYKRAQRNRSHGILRTLLNVVFNTNTIPNRIPFEELPSHLQRRIEHEINTHDPDDSEISTLAALRKMLTDIETNNNVFDMHMELVIADTHSMPVAETLQQHNSEIIKQEENFLSDTTFKVTSGVPEQLLTPFAHEN